MFRWSILFMILFFEGFPLMAFAGPPFFTDDPEPVEYKHHEAYLFSTVDKINDSKTVQGPAVEYNIGAAPNLQLHVVAPFTYFSPKGDSSHWGFADMELGTKYRFINEADNRPQVGIFPQVELASGDPDRGLGNGKTWYKLPVWLQKSWGPWTTYGGGGYALNDGVGMRNYGYGGWLLQRNFGEHLTLGGEIFAQQASTEGGRGYTLFNLGGYYNFTSNFSLLFSVGHTFTGERHALAYLGLYWTWGPEKG